MKFEFVCLPTKGIEFGEGIVRMIFVIDAVDSFVPYIACFLVFFCLCNSNSTAGSIRLLQNKRKYKKRKRKQRVVFSKEGSFEWEIFYLII